LNAVSPGIGRTLSAGSSDSSEIAVVHLVWAPLGAEALEGFLAAYGRFTPGVEHRLVVILNGFDGKADPRRVAVERALEGFAHQAIVLPSPVVDLTAYREAAPEIDAQTLCLLNSYSRPLVPNWLALLARGLSDASVGLVGCGGSCESAYSAAPFWLRRRRGREFPPFPNPHVRTNGFMLDRELMLDLDWPLQRSKLEALALESGKRSISRQVWERGLDVRVVGRDGVAYPPERWRESATFRSDGQRNLLISDNRTLQYEQADAAFKDTLERMAWGPA
jgi:hypothetical protein